MDYRDIVVGLLLLAVALLVFWRVRRDSAPPAAGGPEPVPQPRPRPSVEKCEVKVFAFADGFKTTVHSRCDRAGLLGDADAARLHPESTLKAVRSFVHLVKVK